MKSGVYYYNGKIVATYKQGGMLNVEVGINAHHNGYIEMHICDVNKCPGGEISEKCFQMGFCYKLDRAWVKECQTGYSKRCAPIDRNYPGRWYLPCYGYRDRSGVIARYGMDGTMMFKLPEHLQCRHCVLHWYWTSANTCNPPGVLEYFDGPDRPRGWGNCPGQGGARGGVARNQRPCGGGYRGKIPEEYMSCADVTILPSGGVKHGKKKTTVVTKTKTKKRETAGNRKPVAAPAPSVVTTKKKKKPASSTTMNKKKALPKPRSTSSSSSSKSKPKASKPKPKPPQQQEQQQQQKSGGGYDAAKAFRRGSKGIRDIVLIDRGRRVASLNMVNRIRVRDSSRLSVEALTESKVTSVTFKVDGKTVGTDYAKPFFIMGNDKNKWPITWKPPLNKWLTITVMTKGDKDRVEVYFQK